MPVLINDSYNNYSQLVSILDRVLWGYDSLLSAFHVDVAPTIDGSRRHRTIGPREGRYRQEIPPERITDAQQSPEMKVTANSTSNRRRASCSQITTPKIQDLDLNNQTGVRDIKRNRTVRLRRLTF